jgi:beta-N-acetylhexosaminidase
MTLEEKIGQMVLVGFRGLTVDEKSPVIEDIREKRIGGVILFDRDVDLGSDVRNIESRTQLKKLITSLQDFAGGDLFVAVDQEGGLITRLKDKHGFNQVASHKKIGDENDRDFTIEQAASIADALATVGFNMNFAPVVDLNLNPENPVIGSYERSISDKVDIVVKHAAIIIDELKKRNIISVLKHYPGHGSSTADSHDGFVDVTKIWQLKELSTFRDLIEMGKAEAIMTAHIYNSNYDKKHPATLSKAWLTGILRYGLEFDNVVITDDLQMKAISKHYTLVEAIELAINAGADILMFANNVDFDQDIARKVNEIILQLVQNGRISEERIEEAYNRIINLKKNILN